MNGTDIKPTQALCYVPDPGTGAASAIGSTLGIIAGIMLCCFCCVNKINQKCKRGKDDASRNDESKTEAISQTKAKAVV